VEPPTKRRKYQTSFRLKVIKMAKELNNCAAARAFDITEERKRSATFLRKYLLCR
jgi:transposase-like protein